jgi:hypothetical protein
MNAYPSFPQLIGSAVNDADDLIVDTAVSGSSKARSFYANRKAHILLKHNLSDADLATLEAFYDANKLLAVAFTWQRDGSSYTCLMAGPPQKAIVSGFYSTVTVNLVEQ